MIQIFLSKSSLITWRNPVNPFEQSLNQKFHKVKCSSNYNSLKETDLLQVSKRESDGWCPQAQKSETKPEHKYQDRAEDSRPRSLSNTQQMLRRRRLSSSAALVPPGGKGIRRWIIWRLKSGNMWNILHDWKQGGWREEQMLSVVFWTRFDPKSSTTADLRGC